MSEKIAISQNDSGEPVAVFTFSSKTSSTPLTEIHKTGNASYYVGLISQQHLDEKSTLPFDKIFAKNSNGNLENKMAVVLFEEVEVNDKKEVKPVAFLSGNFGDGNFFGNKSLLEGIPILESIKISGDGKFSDDNLIPKRITYTDGRMVPLSNKELKKFGLSDGIEIEDGKVSDGDGIMGLFEAYKDKIQSSISPDMQKAIMLAGNKKENFVSELSSPILAKNPTNHQPSRLV